MNYLLALAAAVMAFSCQRVAEIDVFDETPSTEIDEVRPTDVKMVTVSCTIADVDPESKVTLTNDGSVGKTEWENGDEVLFHGAFVGTSGSDYYSYVAAAHDVSGDGKTAQFTIPEIAMRFNHSNINWTSDARTTDIYAIYPASAAADFSDGDEWYFISAFKNTNHLLLAGVNDTRVDGGYSFTFINLTGALSFKVNSDGTGGFDSYTFCGNNNEVLGYTNYCIKTDRTGDTNDYRTLYTGSDGPGPTSGEIHSITVGSAMSPWTGHDGTTINTIYFPNGANFSSGFTIKFYKDGSEVRRVSTNTAKNVAVGKYLDLGTITSHMYTYTPPTPHNNNIGVDVDAAETINLSASATANCYMIDGSDAANAGASFKFKATKGKGGDVLKGGTAAVNIGGDEDNDVVLLWATKNTDSAPTATEIITAVDYDLQGDGDPYIVFKTPSTIVPGNAVIAAKNSSGDILWSWHIWIPETTVSTVDYGIHTTAMMSRNLGALIDAEASTSLIDVTSIGLFYQWGRKDPFPGPATNTEDYPDGASVVGASMSINDGQISLSQSIQNPLLYGKYSGDWCSDHNAEYWGDSGSKSQYDPCPPGYRVPKRDEAEDLWWTNETEFLAKTGWEYNDTYNWFTLGSPKAVFPLTGYIDSGTYNRVQKGRTAIWNSHVDGDNSAYCRYVYEGPRAVRYAHNKSKGYSVRCCVE